jgi:hypothetical protein
MRDNFCYKKSVTVHEILEALRFSGYGVGDRFIVTKIVPILPTFYPLKIFCLNFRERLQKNSID